MRTSQVLPIRMSVVGLLRWSQPLRFDPPVLDVAVAGMLHPRLPRLEARP